MANKTNVKRLSKGQRTHVRKMKQEARKAGVTYKPANPYVAPSIEKV